MDRKTYLLVGLIGFVIKHNLDRFIATFVFHKKWGIFNYIVPLNEMVSLTLISKQDAVFLISMLVLALPFIWIGLSMTLRRLRDANLPLGLITLFFIPFVNLIFFVVLSLLPSAPSPDGSSDQNLKSPNTFLSRLIPNHPIGSAAMAFLITVPLGIAWVWLGTSIFTKYGWALFVALPFCLGLISVLLYSYHEKRDLGSCICVAVLSGVILGVGLLAAAIEGFICILMAAPIGAVISLMGGIVGWLIQKNRFDKVQTQILILVFFFVVPLLMGAEYLHPSNVPEFIVTSTVDIQASPKKVWKNVVSFSQLPEPQELLFKVGLAYPIRAEINGQGKGAIRHCIFSTGTFVEPIEVWDEPKLLKFSVTSNPAPMQEWTPYKEIHPPHLEHFFVSSAGQFKLVPLKNGNTRLEGTTWYTHNMWPTNYWQIYSDFIIHRIHLRVLNHIKHLAE